MAIDINKISLNEIKPQGLKVEDDIDPEFIGLSKEDYFQFISPVHVKAELKRIEDVILTHVDVKGKYESFCARSLERLEDEWEQSFNIDFEIKEDVDYINLADDIRQEIILRAPMRLISKEERMKEIEESKHAEPVEEEDETQETYQPFKNLKEIE